MMVEPMVQRNGAAHVGRRNHDLAEVELLLDVADHQWRRVEIVGRDVKEATLTAVRSIASLQ
jgi:hypothetical protein